MNVKIGNNKNSNMIFADRIKKINITNSEKSNIGFRNLNHVKCACENKNCVIGIRFDSGDYDVMIFQDKNGKDHVMQLNNINIINLLASILKFPDAQYYLELYAKDFSKNSESIESILKSFLKFIIDDISK